MKAARLVITEAMSDYWNGDVDLTLGDEQAEAILAALDSAGYSITPKEQA